MRGTGRAAGGPAKGRLEPSTRRRHRSHPGGRLRAAPPLKVQAAAAKTGARTGGRAARSGVAATRQAVQAASFVGGPTRRRRYQRPQLDLGLIAAAVAVAVAAAIIAGARSSPVSSPSRPTAAVTVAIPAQ